MPPKEWERIAILETKVENLVAMVNQVLSNQKWHEDKDQARHELTMQSDERIISLIEELRKEWDKKYISVRDFNIAKWVFLFLVPVVGIIGWRVSSLLKK